MGNKPNNLRPPHIRINHFSNNNRDLVRWISLVVEELICWVAEVGMIYWIIHLPSNSNLNNPSNSLCNLYTIIITLRRFIT